MIYKRPLFILQVLAILIMPLVSKSQPCKMVKISDFPAKDRPSVSAREQLKGKQSYKYYYGVGVAVDYVKARLIAFIEMETKGNNEGEFEGSSILMMLYANGYGVKRNLDLSIRLACANVGGAGAEVEGRVQHLKDMKSGGSEEAFDICDDITSGLMEGMCQSIHSEIADIERTSKVNSIIKKWPKQDQLAYGRLRKAASVFFDKRAGLEVDLSGTARAAMVLQETASLEDGFKEMISDAAQCGFVKYSSQEFVELDVKLNAVYSKIMNTKDPGWGTVTKDDIKQTQRQWLQYRDAWVAFGAVRCPAVTADSWKALLTKERIVQLKDFVDE